jgi:hypothetical protein
MDLPEDKKYKYLEEDWQKVLNFIYKNPQN